MPSILIHGSDQQSRREATLRLLTEKGVGSDHSLINIGEEKEKIGINEIKTLLPHLHVRPAGKQRAVVIYEAQRLTIASQNALLKLLEEPPTYLTIILTVPNPKLLLPTVVSRCLVSEAKRRGAGPQAVHTLVAKEILSVQGGQRLALFEEKIGYHQKSVFLFLDAVEAYLKERLNQKNAQLLKKLWQAKKLLGDETANVKLIVDELLLSW